MVVFVFVQMVYTEPIPSTSAAMEQVKTINNLYTIC